MLVFVRSAVVIRIRKSKRSNNLILLLLLRTRNQLAPQLPRPVAVAVAVEVVDLVLVMVVAKTWKARWLLLWSGHGTQNVLNALDVVPPFQLAMAAAAS